MKEKISQRDMELGFDDCRFTSADSPQSAGQFQNWLAKKNHGEMNWLELNAPKRIDPQKILPDAKSVICLATSYEIFNRRSRSDETPNSSKLSIFESQSPVTSAPTTGIVARYARFDDYHDVLGERLKLLAQFVNQLGDKTRSLWYVDTGPLLERDLAQRAGIGFVGKHTNLISRKLGNWIFLSEIITTLELEPDAPEKNHCGKCSRCISACPTNAITAPFQLDARKCISYLTIELKGSIPIEFRRAIGNRIYGCDDCLAVCPWNRFAREGKLMKSLARKELAEPDLIELLSLDDKQFKLGFTNSPILRTKRRGFLRNVCVALGNTGDESALPALEKSSRDSEPLIGEHAHWAISEIESRRK
jgi:epoxyqueuosine reductase